MSRAAYSFRVNRKVKVRRPPPGSIRPNPDLDPSEVALGELMRLPITTPWTGNVMPTSETRIIGNDDFWISVWAIRPDEVTALSARRAGVRFYPTSIIAQSLHDFSDSLEGPSYRLLHFDPATDEVVFESDDGQDEVTHSLGAFRTLLQVLGTSWDRLTATEHQVCFWTHGSLAAVLMAEPDQGAWEEEEEEDGNDVKAAPAASRQAPRVVVDPNALDPRDYHVDTLGERHWERLGEMERTEIDDLSAVFGVGTTGSIVVEVYGHADFEEFGEEEFDWEVCESSAGKVIVRLTDRSKKVAYEGEGGFLRGIAASLRDGTDPDDLSVAVVAIEIDRIGHEVAQMIAQYEGAFGTLEICAGGFMPAVVARASDRRVVGWAFTVAEALHLRDHANAGLMSPRMLGAASGPSRLIDPDGALDEATIVRHFGEGAIVVLDSGSPGEETYLGHFQVCGGHLWTLASGLCYASAGCYIDSLPGGTETLVLPAEPVSWTRWKKFFFEDFTMPPVVTAASRDDVFPARYGVPYYATSPGAAPGRRRAPPPAGPAYPPAGRGERPALPASLDPLEGAGLARPRREGPGPVARGPSRRVRDLYTGEIRQLPDGTPGLAPPRDMDHARPAAYGRDGQLVYTREDGQLVSVRGLPAAAGNEPLLLPVTSTSRHASGAVEMHVVVPILGPSTLRLRDLVTGDEYELPADAALPAAPAQMDLSHPAQQGSDGWTRYMDLGGRLQVAALWASPLVAAPGPVLAAVNSADGRGDWELHAMVVRRDAA